MQIVDLITNLKFINDKAWFSTILHQVTLVTGGSFLPSWNNNIINVVNNKKRKYYKKKKDNKARLMSQAGHNLLFSLKLLVINY